MSSTKNMSKRNKFFLEKNINDSIVLIDTLKNNLQNKLEVSRKRFPQQTSPIGGKNKKDYLKNKTLKSLQKMARNKNIKITKKVDGKIKYIKKASLIRKLL